MVSQCKCAFELNIRVCPVMALLAPSLAGASRETDQWNHNGGTVRSLMGVVSLYWRESCVDLPISIHSLK